ncbi:hypothetical protein PHJA_001154600 [Phtheirospermum japonicum]|uniref:Neprosin PEP catalytic domain-containing protein n=1 Tax=Phtheirospermum japonicum TaxID=374723 RepID=A0A830BYL7_9LAMI|nr:hypothetical protein PHJA_001154600 [Phtheirospermum japonicum]
MATRNRLFSRTLVIPILLSLIVLVHFSKKCVAISNSLNYTKYRHVSSLRLARIQSHLDKINKPPVFTIESPDGDIIDCVRKRKQPALDHPLLKHHKIQRVPPKMPKAIKSAHRHKGAFGQMWHQKGELCPKGTVPIRRSTVDDVLRAKSLYDFGKKRARCLTPFDRPMTKHAVALTSAAQAMYGAKASIGLWDPTVETCGEFSLSQIWVMLGSFNKPSDLNTIEVGWQVDPQMYGDKRPRFFTYWTRDAYRSTGCYNLLCSGFVQVNRRIVIGAAFSPVSSIGGNLSEITITVWKDPKKGNWWLALRDISVGYWPSKLFTHLADQATLVEWGGEIVNAGANHRHTSTQMGSGHFAEDGYGKASYFRNLETVDWENNLVPVQGVTTIVEKPKCYNIQSSNNNEWGTYFYYGGPGRSPQCP